MWLRNADVVEVFDSILSVTGKYQTAAVAVQFVKVFSCMTGKHDFGRGCMAT